MSRHTCPQIEEYGYCRCGGEYHSAAVEAIKAEHADIITTGTVEPDSRRILNGKTASPNDPDFTIFYPS